MTDVEKSSWLAFLSRLERAAQAATPGAWCSTGVVIAAPGDGGMDYLLECCDGGEDHPNLAFVELAQPINVLELINLARKGLETK